MRFLLLSCALLLTVSGIGSYTALPALAQAGKPAVTLQSLAGDWTSDDGRSVWTMHLTAGPSGSLSGWIDARDYNPPAPPKRLGVSEMKFVNASLLSFKISGIGNTPLPSYESVDPDGNSMQGQQVWTRKRVSQTTDADLLGDWVASPGDPQKGPFLHIRRSASGGLTGTYELISDNRYLSSVSNPVTNIHGGQAIGYTIGSAVFDGILSADGKTLTMHSKTVNGATSATWTRLRTITQALAIDATHKPAVTDGTWKGAVNQTITYAITNPTDAARMGGKVGVPYPTRIAMTVVLHAASNPARCTMEDKDDRNNHLACTITVTGNRVHIDLPLATLTSIDGTLSSDGRQIVGRLNVAPGLRPTPASVPLTLFRAQ